MTDILETIIVKKQQEVVAQKKQRPVSELEKMPGFERKPLSMRSFLLQPDKTGIIAEYKRRSPSKGVINGHSTVQEVTGAYAMHGASGISVLTDETFFGGSLADLAAARFNHVPLLRKDFTIDEYQLIEARAYGADVILLIAACLSPQQVKSLSATAKSLGLEVLLELHTAEELDHICDTVDMVGVNNRNLKNFEVDLEHSVRLAQQIDDGFVKVAESGINDIQNIRYLKSFGFTGFLIGEYFMKQQEPAAAFQSFAQKLTAE